MWIRESSLAAKFGNQSSVITVETSNVHQAKSGQKLFRVGEGGAGGSFGLVDAGFHEGEQEDEDR